MSRFLEKKKTNIELLEQIIMEMPTEEYDKISKALVIKKTAECKHPNDIIDNKGMFMNTWHCPDCGRYADDF